ncbi:hypothetical protein BC829DRAFT_363891, partial [Chytridium lagenaria]
FYLENDSQCICGLKITDCTSPRRLRWSKLYDENGAVTCFVETAKCTQCPSRSNRYIGPDLGNLGIFNKNNFCLVTHFFLDKITELITSTTFSFYVYHKHLKSNYNEYGAGKCHIPPPSPKVISSIWFAFRVRQDLTLNMEIQCPICKRDGYDLVACDGISIGYQEDKRTQSLRPPTTLETSSTQNRTVQYIRGKQVR